MEDLRNWLKKSATARSFSRGKSYYEDVKNLEQEGDKFTAQVYGSSRYFVNIQIDDLDISSYCSCPYDWGGICKHIVAVGLNIADGNYTKAMPSEDIFYGNVKRKSEINSVEEPTVYNRFKKNQAEENDYEEEEEEENFEDLFYNTSESMKLLFLKDLLSDNPFLQERFKEHISK